jgi:peptidoglycan/LPS O-acetylase OafA/YrhL
MTAVASVPRQELPALTGLRFFAAIAITIHHMQGAFGFPKDMFPQMPLSNGVSFFYVLSGFILTYVYRDTASAAGWRTYILARIARVWPLHLATFALICIIISPPSRIGTDSGLFAAFLNLTLLHAWIPDYRYFFSFNAVSWSISVEMFFYLTLPLVLLRPGRWLLLSLAAVGVLVVLATSIGAGPYRPGDTSPSITSLMYINPVARLFEFILGVVTALVWIRKISKRREAASVAIQVAALTFTAASWTWVPTIAALSPNLAINEWLYHGGITCLSSAAVIVAFATSGGLSRIFSFAPLVYLGKLSFALYLVHQIPIHAHNLGIEPFSSISWPLYLTGVILVSAALHHFVENPARHGILKASQLIVDWRLRL